jgi:anti-sigma B factor antagonist
MNITQYDIDGVRIAAIEGRVDINGVPELNRFSEQIAAEGASKIIIDMGKVVYMNSDSLHVLAQIQSEARNRGGDLRLVRLSPVVQKVFQIVGFRRFFRNYSSVETARIGF